MTIVLNKDAAATGTTRGMCVQIAYDPCSDDNRQVTASWCGRNTTRDKFVFPGATSAVSSVWGMNGVSICKACGERMMKLIGQNIEERKGE